MSNMYTGITVNPTKAKKILKICVKSGTNAMMWGKWGVGKTSITYQLAEEIMDEKNNERYFDSCIVINPSQDDVIDFKLPYLDKIKLDGQESSISRFAISERLPRSGRHLIFVDEINTAMPSMQATLYSLVLEQRIGNYRLPKGCVCFAAGNREEDGCAALPMSNALKDRLGVHMNVVPDEASWVDWATKNGVAPEVVAFVRDNPTRLEGHCTNDSGDPTGGCTPRSLKFLSDMVKTGLEDDVAQTVANGIVGAGAGAEFMGFLDIFKNHIDIDDIIARPQEVTVPKRIDILYSVVSALETRVDDNNIEPIIKFLSRLERRYMIMCLQGALNRNPRISDNAHFSKYIRENYKYFITKG